MPLFKLTKNDLTSVTQGSLTKLGIREREDLQRVLKNNIQAIAPGTLVIAEEFSEWTDSRRRIDLLGIDEDGSLVVIELKRTADGGHMELQAIRYAAMVSNITYDRVVEVFSKYLTANNRDDNAEELILSHLGWDSEGDGEIADQTRIILVSEDFGSEITTTVLWLNEQSLDIKCVRVMPYVEQETIFLDIQQIIPLPETSDYMVRLREKESEKKINRRKQARDFTRYIVTADGQASATLPKRRAMLSIVTQLIKNGKAPAEIQSALHSPRRRFFSIPELLETEEEFIEAAPHHLELNNVPSFSPRRWFTSDEELLRHDGATFILSNQWGVSTEDEMKNLLKTFSDVQLQVVRA